MYFKLKLINTIDFFKVRHKVRVKNQPNHQRFGYNYIILQTSIHLLYFPTNYSWYHFLIFQSFFKLRFLIHLSLCLMSLCLRPKISTAALFGNSGRWVGAGMHWPALACKGRARAKAWEWKPLPARVQALRVDATVNSNGHWQ